MYKQAVAQIGWFKVTLGASDASLTQPAGQSGGSTGPCSGATETSIKQESTPTKEPEETILKQ